MIWWEDNMFGIPQPTSWFMDTTITPAPWRPTSYCETDFLCQAFDEWGFGAVAPGPLGLLHDLSDWAYDQFYGLMVVWQWDSNPGSFGNFYKPPAAFHYEYIHHRADSSR